MAEVGLIRFVVTCSVALIVVERSSWDEFAIARMENMRIELSLLRRKDDQTNSAREHFVCFGKATFKGPKQQFYVLLSGALISLPTLSVSARKLTLSIHYTANLIIKTRLAERVCAQTPRFTEELTLAEVSSISTDLEAKIRTALQLNLQIQPRINRTNGGGIVLIHGRNQADERVRWMAVTTATLWGWNDQNNNFARRQEIAKAACKQVAYDFGIQSAVSKQHFMCRNHHDALAKSVISAWSWRLHSQAFLNVWQRLKVVLTSIIDDRGGNHLVEERQGKLFQNIDITVDNHGTIGNLNNNSTIAVAIDLEEDDSFDDVDLDINVDTN